MTTHADRLRILPEFQPEEYDEFRDVLFGRLSNRLARWNPDQVSLELSVKDRNKRSQRTVLECWITGKPKLGRVSPILAGGSGRPEACSIAMT